MRLHHVRRGSGAPLVLLHGIGDSHRMWTNVMGRLARAHEVIAVDLPGFGGSRTLRDTEPTPAALADAVAAFMGGEPFHVAGNSLGGGVALELGRAGRARSVTAISPVGFARGWERRYLRMSLGMTRTVAPRIPRRALASPLVRRLVALQMSERPIPRAELGGAIDDLGLAPGWDAALDGLVSYDFEGAVDVPVTVAWGEHDRLLLPRQSARARTALPSAHHEWLRGCGHIPTWDDPERVARVILATTARARSDKPN